MSLLFSKMAIPYKNEISYKEELKRHSGVRMLLSLIFETPILAYDLGTVALALL
jgi:hypothetical protein